MREPFVLTTINELYEKGIIPRTITRIRLETWCRKNGISKVKVEVDKRNSTESGRGGTKQLVNVHGLTTMQVHNLLKHFRNEIPHNV